MKTIKKIFFLSTLFAVVFTSFLGETVAQQRNISSSSTPVLTFYSSSAHWPSRWKGFSLDGKSDNTSIDVAIHKSTNTKLVAKMNRGQIIQIGIIPSGGKFTPIDPNSKPCSEPSRRHQYSAVQCYTMPWGECVCICGEFMTLGK